MVRYSGFLFALIILGSCISRKLSSSGCNSFRKGKFTMNWYNASGIGHWRKMTFLIEREDSLQTVIRQFPIADTTIEKIRWNTPCEYYVYNVANQNNFLDSAILKMFPNGIHHKIIKATKSYYIEKHGEEKDTLWLNSY